MIPNLVMMALGSFRFGVSNDLYQEYQRSAAFRWEKVNRIGVAPALQYGGPDAETLKLSGVIYPHFSGGLRQVDLLVARAGSGVPMMMVDGMGWNWKRWVILSVDETRTLFMADGAPQKIEFSMTLESYNAGLDLVSKLKGLFA